MELTDYQKIELIKKIKDFNSDSALAKFLGVNPQTFYDIKAEVHGLSKKMIDKILEKIPEINKSWLMTGEGDMITNDNSAVSVKIENSAISNVDTANNCTFNNSVVSAPKEKGRRMEQVLGCKDGCLLPVDMKSIPKDIRLRDYCLNHCAHDFDIRQLVPRFTFVYQIRTRLLEPAVFQGDWLCVHLITDKSKLTSGRVYLVDSPEHGRMVKRLEETRDSYILSLPVSRKDYPLLEVSKDCDMDFYEIVSRISNDVGSIFSESAADFHQLACTTIDSTNHLIKVLEKVLERN